MPCPCERGNCPQIDELRAEMHACSTEKDARLEHLHHLMERMDKAIERLDGAIERMANSMEEMSVTIRGLGTLPKAWSTLIGMWDFLGFLQKNAIRLIFVGAIIYITTTPEGITNAIKLLGGP